MNKRIRYLKKQIDEYATLRNMQIANLLCDELSEELNKELERIK